MVEIITSVLIITVNVHGLNYPVKRHRFRTKHGGSCPCSQLLGRQIEENCRLKTGRETVSKNNPGMVVQDCQSSYVGGIDKSITDKASPGK
jgi:predicted NAD/FAD-binding protein